MGERQQKIHVVGLTRLTAPLHKVFSLADELTLMQHVCCSSSSVWGTVAGVGDGAYGRPAFFFLPGTADEVAVHRQLDGRQAVAEDGVAEFEIVRGGKRRLIHGVSSFVILFARKNKAVTYNHNKNNRPPCGSS